MRNPSEKVIECVRKLCPLCRKAYTGAPELSRTDNTTLICPDCGTRQALASIGVDAAEQEEILAVIHRSMNGNTQ